MSVPKFESFMLPILKIFKDGKEHNVKECKEKVISFFDLKKEDEFEMVKSGKKSKIDDRVGWSMSYLSNSKLLQNIGKGKYIITERGKELLNSKPKIINRKLLSQFPEYMEFKSGTKNIKKMEDKEIKNEINKIESKFVPIKNLNDSLKLSDENCEKNQIFYGAPGCGKSNRIERIIEENKKNIAEYVRILFHPDYSYTDFIGQLQPKVIKENGKDDKVTYEFIEGPFTQILKKAINDKKNKNYVLIIDEINRGNAPAIFGDIFQLLDRKKGKSVYAIRNSNISEKIYGEGSDKEIRLPENLYIFATMNTSDQNVFTLDTAFKRRWYFERISNKFNDKSDDIYTKKLANTEIHGLGISWREFQERVNITISEELYKYGINGEDKQLGKYFVTETDLENRKKFAYKVLMYLWEDVVKIDRTILFKDEYKTLDELIEDFVENNGIEIFKEGIFTNNM